MRLSFCQFLRSATCAVFLGTTTSLAAAQPPNGCIAIGDIGAEVGKPFSAEIVVSDKNLADTGEGKDSRSRVQEFVARDRDGRIRDEKRIAKDPSTPERMNTLTWPDGEIRTVPQNVLSDIIMIFDCEAGTVTLIKPAMRYATVQQRPESSGKNPNRIPFSAHFLPNVNTKSSPNSHVEDLGVRDIQGIPAHGVRYTFLGTESDGEWNGKTVSESEQWVSDELAAFVLRRNKDFRTGREGKSEMVNIRHEDPDPALFEIPADCKINPKVPEDLPWAKDAGTMPSPQK